MIQGGSGWTALHPVVTACSRELAGLSGPLKLQGLSEAAGQALERSARISGVALGELEKDDNGAPLPSGGVHWSISHTEGCVAAVVAPCRVGIDVEKIRDVSAALREQVATRAEWELASSHDKTLFFRYWTAKEAVLKAAGHGLSGLPECRIAEVVDDSLLRVVYQGKDRLVHHQEIPLSMDEGVAGHIVSMTQGSFPTVWHVIGLA